MKGKKILITGANGFTGSFLTEEALRRGYDTYAGIRKNASKQNLQNSSIKFVEIDYTSKDHFLEHLRPIPIQEIR